MRFDKKLHQKVRYDGQLYVVLLDEFPEYHKEDQNYKVVLHPIANEWIVRITNPMIRAHMMVEKGNTIEVPHHVPE
jgi:hypothetical protein